MPIDLIQAIVRQTTVAQSAGKHGRERAAPCAASVLPDAAVSPLLMARGPRRLLLGAPTGTSAARSCERLGRVETRRASSPMARATRSDRSDARLRASSSD